MVVRLLKTERRAVDLREWVLDTPLYPSGFGKPRVAIPVFTRDELRAFALYGGHRDHTELDSSEIDLLSWLAEKCAAAFDHVEVCALRALLLAQRGYQAALLSRLNLRAVHPGNRVGSCIPRAITSCRSGGR